MRKHLLVVASILVVILLAPLFSDMSDLSAQSGCCKERRSNRGSWYPNGLNYQQCFELNKARDGDDLHKKEGLVWWAPSC